MQRVVQRGRDYRPADPGRAIALAWNDRTRFMNIKEHKSVMVLNQALKIAGQNDAEETLRLREATPAERPLEVLERESVTRQDPSLANVKGVAETHMPPFPCPTWNPDPNENLFLTDSQESIAFERFRSLRTRLLRMRENRRLQTILIVSARPGEGKSVIAANLAQVMAAHTSDRVLLMDGDLRRPRLHAVFGAPASPGLHECLSGEVNYVACIQQSPMEGFYFLPAGHCDNRSPGLLAGSGFEDLLVQLRRGFEWIVIDSPAAVSVSDAAVLAEHCDAVLVVVRAGTAKQEELKQVCEQFESSKLLGVVLNGKPPEKKDTYAYSASGNEKNAR